MAMLVTTTIVEPKASLLEVNQVVVNSGAKTVAQPVEDAIPVRLASLIPTAPRKDNNQPKTENFVPSNISLDVVTACTNAPPETSGSTHERTVSETSSQIVNTPGLLEKYIQLALTGHSTASTHSLCKCPLPKIFLEDTENPHLRPTLQRDTVNRILLYTGSFDPPHISHRAVLHDGFFHSGADMNLVAAIVIPWTGVHALFRSEKDPIVLRQEDRGALWTGGYTVPPVLKKCRLSNFTKVTRMRIEARIRAGHSDEWYRSKLESPLYTGPATEESENHLGNWAFVYPNEDAGSETFLEDLKSCASEDGFEIAFVRLFGADKAHKSRFFCNDPWGCQDYLLSDAGRDLSCSSNAHHGERETTGFDTTNAPGKPSSCDNAQAPLCSNEIAPSALTRIKRFSPWHSVSISPFWSQALAERAAQAYYLASGFRGADSAGQAKLVTDLAWIYMTRDRAAFSRFKECHADMSRVRYVPRLHPLPSPEVSSTRMRELIVTSENEEEVKTAMEGMALNPALLARVIAGKAGRPNILSSCEQLESWYDRWAAGEVKEKASESGRDIWGG